MLKSIYGALVLSGAIGFSIVAGPQGAEAQARSRQSMEQCVQRVLASLAKAGAPETQVGPAVISQCDGPLRATLAESIRTGEAGSCTVESCLALARERAAGEATAAYRQAARR